MAGKIDVTHLMYQLQNSLNQVNAWLKDLPHTLKTAPRDEQAAYGAVGAGILFLLAGIVLSFIL